VVVKSAGGFQNYFKIVIGWNFSQNDFSIHDRNYARTIENCEENRNC